MSNGRLGVSMSVANDTVKVYTAPVGIAFATINIDLLNTDTTADAQVSLYLSTSDTPGVGDMIDKATLTAGGHLIQSCRVLSVGEKVIVWSDKATVAIRVEGLEEII